MPDAVVRCRINSFLQRFIKIRDKLMRRFPLSGEARVYERAAKKWERKVSLRCLFRFSLNSLTRKRACHGIFLSRRFRESMFTLKCAREGERERERRTGCTSDKKAGIIEASCSWRRHSMNRANHPDVKGGVCTSVTSLWNAQILITKDRGASKMEINHFRNYHGICMSRL